MSKLKNKKKPTKNLKEIDSFDVKNVVFCFKDLTHNNDYSLKSLSDNQKADVLDTISQLSTENWIDLNSKRKNNGGYETLPKSKISIPPNCPMDNKEKYHVFRCNHSGRIIGTKTKFCFKVLFIDFKYKLYNHS